MRSQQKPFPFRTVGYALTALGIAFVLCGAAGLVIAAALPWATVTLLNTSLSVPGFALGWGGVSAGIGVLCVAQFGFLRRFAFIALGLGVAAAGIGLHAERETGKSVVRYLLNIQRRLAPVNARLAEVTLPPIEPFGSRINRRRDYVGAGVGYTIWAGGAVAAGSVLLMAGDRWRRTCGYCRRAWSAKRGESVSFCPNCGKRPVSVPLCTECATPLLRGERFCPVCGTGTAPRVGAIQDAGAATGAGTTDAEPGVMTTKVV